MIAIIDKETAPLSISSANQQAHECRWANTHWIPLINIDSIGFWKQNAANTQSHCKQQTSRRPICQTFFSRQTQVYRHSCYLFFFVRRAWSADQHLSPSIISPVCLLSAAVHHHSPSSHLRPLTTDQWYYRRHHCLCRPHRLLFVCKQAAAKLASDTNWLRQWDEATEASPQPPLSSNPISCLCSFAYSSHMILFSAVQI